jgi:hypothetical protein
LKYSNFVKQNKTNEETVEQFVTKL